MNLAVAYHAGTDRTFDTDAFLGKLFDGFDRSLVFAICRISPVATGISLIEPICNTNSSTCGFLVWEFNCRGKTIDLK